MERERELKEKIWLLQYSLANYGWQKWQNIWVFVAIQVIPAIEEASDPLYVDRKKEYSSGGYYSG